ncbi:MAG: YlxR family protein [Chloroflexi bacterium]|nr:YlxR family protein [Chloroflexota bacterium]
MAKARHVPERRCVACGQRAPKRQFTRIVRTPEGTVMADATGKASGRGGYLCSSGDCWDKGISKGSLERSLQITISRDDRVKLLDYYRSQVAQEAPLEA